MAQELVYECRTCKNPVTINSGSSGGNILQRVFWDDRCETCFMVELDRLHMVVPQTNLHTTSTNTPHATSQSQS